MIARIREAFDARHALELLQKAISIPSVTGDEPNFAGWLKGELIALGVAGLIRRIRRRPPQRLGPSEGEERGRYAFVDRSHRHRAHSWLEGAVGRKRAGKPLLGRGGRRRGLGPRSSDLKAGICMTLEAVRTLDRAGIEVDPTLLFAFVGDEESGEPGSGVSAGARAFTALIAAGTLPLPAWRSMSEPTMLDVYVAHMGFFLCEIRIIGKSAYFGVPELGVDALKGAHAVLDALWRYSAELSAGEKHALVGSGFLLPTGIQGGGYIAVPGECTISLIAKIPPGVRLDDVRAGLETAARAASMDSRIELQFFYPAPRDHSIGGQPFESRLDEARLHRLVSAVRAVRPERGNLEAAPYWSELPILSALGVPGVYFAPGDIRSATRRKRTSAFRTITTASSPSLRFWREPIVVSRFVQSTQRADSAT